MVNGTGQILLSSTNAPRGTQSLMITATKSKESYYSNGVYRNIYLWNTTNANLSFYLNATTSSPYDFVALIVSDQSWSNKIYFASPNLIPSENMIKLPTANGFFKFNLSQAWEDLFNSSLPTSIYIVIQVTDVDGITDTGYVDYIALRGEESIGK